MLNKFEAEITIVPCLEHRESEFYALVQEHAAMVLHPKVNTIILTGKDYEVLRKQMYSMLEQLKARDFLVLRYKLTQTWLDSKYNDSTFPLPHK